MNDPLLAFFFCFFAGYGATTFLRDLINLARYR